MRPLLALAALALCASAAHADDPVQTTEAVGRATLEGDPLAARERAKDDALRSCVQQVATGIVTAAAEPDQAQLLAERIYAGAVGYVRKFQVLDDRQDGNGWTTKVRCDVSEARLEEDLLASGIAYRRAGMPRLLVLLAEQPIGAARPTGAWEGLGGAAELRVLEAALVDRLERCGFGFVDREAVKVKLGAVGAEPTPEQARALGASAGAEVVVVGRATARPLGEQKLDTGTFFSAVASVSARAIRTDTGEVVAVVELTGPAGRGFEQASAGRSALSGAGRQLARELFARIGKAWARERSGLRRLAVAVRGVGDYARLAAFKSALASQRGVKDVQERSMEDGRAELEVTLAGTSRALATDLATRRFPGFGVKVRNVTASAVEVELE